MAAVAGFFLSVLVAGVAVGRMGFHEVQEGHVGLYFFGGRLLEGTTGPGFHWKGPLTRHVSVQTTIKTDTVLNVPCGTSGGVMIDFPKIEVVNRLNPKLAWQTVRNYTVEYSKPWLYDRVAHLVAEYCSVNSLQDIYIDRFPEMNKALVRTLQQTCDEYAPGIEVMEIRVSKPQIPEIIRVNYEKMETEKTKLLVAEQRQRVIVKAAETAQARAVAEARKQLEVAEVAVEREVEREKSNAAIEKVSIETETAKQKAHVDAAFYASQQELKGQKRLITERYLDMQRQLAAVQNAKFVIGSKDNLPHKMVIGKDGDL